MAGADVPLAASCQCHPGAYPRSSLATRPPVDYIMGFKWGIEEVDVYPSGTSNLRRLR